MSVDLTKGFKIEWDGTPYGFVLSDAEGNKVGGIAYMELQISAREALPHLRVDFLRGPADIMEDEPEDEPDSLDEDDPDEPTDA